MYAFIVTFRRRIYVCAHAKYNSRCRKRTYTRTHVYKYYPFVNICKLLRRPRYDFRAMLFNI